MPLSNSESQRLDLLPGDLLVEAGDQRPGADGAHGLARDGPGLDRHAEIVSELEQQLVKNIFLTSVRFDVVDAVEQRTFEIVAVRLPRADVGGIELEDAEAEVACEHRVLVLDLLCGAAEAFLGEFGESARFAELVAEVSGSLLVFVPWIKGFRKLHKKLPKEMLSTLVM